MSRRKKIKALDLTNEIRKIYESYSEELKEGIQKIVIEYTEKIISEIKRTAPRSDRSGVIHLADSFDYEIRKDVDNFMTTIYSPDRGFIAHFVEYGSVKNVPKPFMRPAFDKYVPQMENEIKNFIEKAGG